MKLRENLEIILKIIGVAIAAFGVWKYFDSQTQAELVSSKERSLGYIERFGSLEVVAPRRTLLNFWQDHPGASAAIRDGLMTPRGYRLFVASAYPLSASRGETDDALFRLSVFFNEMSHCRSTGICDREILDSFFCEYAQRFVPAYLPFYQVVSQETGSEPLIVRLQSFVMECETLAVEGINR
jgi:hypothetical protein